LAGRKMNIRRSAKFDGLSTNLAPSDRLRAHRLDQVDLALHPERHLLGIAPNEDVLGPYTQDGLRLDRRRAGELVPVERHRSIAQREAGAAQLAVEEVHRRRSDEAGDEEVDRLVVDGV